MLTIESTLVWVISRLDKLAHVRPTSPGYYFTHQHGSLFACIFPSVSKKFDRARMEAKIGKLWESVGNFFTGGDQIPWCDRDIIAGCEQEVAEAQKGSSDEFTSECIMRFSWALVHSKQPGRCTTWNSDA
ncbi:hypothetical protein L1049_018448 [Liquidambar formosana]|uniref:Uncharacterized protein n=1 Tax=Liquidambar formosana TaxID=63359 RepID=A0AAP0WLZ6_LIQFO